VKTIYILSVGKAPSGWQREALDHFCKLARSFTKIELIQVREQKVHDEHAVAKALEKEAADILRAIPERSCVVLLEVTGKRMDTEAFSDWLSGALEDYPSVTFVIGGPNGLDTTLSKEADLLLSMSDFTLPHDLARIVIAEQIFRALSIKHNHPYHR